MFRSMAGPMAAELRGLSRWRRRCLPMRSTCWTCSPDRSERPDLNSSGDPYSTGWEEEGDRTPRRSSALRSRPRVARMEVVAARAHGRHPGSQEAQPPARVPAVPDVGSYRSIWSRHVDVRVSSGRGQREGYRGSGKSQGEIMIDVGTCQACRGDECPAGLCAPCALYDEQLKRSALARTRLEALIPLADEIRTLRSPLELVFVSNPRVRITLDAETGPVWESALRAAAEVAAWPAWKRGE